MCKLNWNEKFNLIVLIHVETHGQAFSANSHCGGDHDDENIFIGAFKNLNAFTYTCMVYLSFAPKINRFIRNPI